MSEISLTDNQYIFGGIEHALAVVIMGVIVFAVFKNTQLFSKSLQKVLAGLLTLLAIAYVGQYIFSVINYTDNIRPIYEKRQYSRTGL